MKFFRDCPKTKKKTIFLYAHSLHSIVIQIKRMQKKMKECINSTEQSASDISVEDMNTLKNIYFMTFPEENCTSNSQNSLEQIYNKIEKDPLFSPIFARIISQLSNLDFEKGLFYKIDVFLKFGSLILKEISENDKIETKKSELLMEKFRNFQKNRESKEKISSFQNFTELLLKRAEKEYEIIKKIDSIDDLFKYIFGIEAEKKEVKKIEFINVKELLLMYNLRGSLIQDIIQKYDGTITFVVSGLTMITNSVYAEEFKPRLEKILEILGSSSQILILQNRLKNNFELYNKIIQEIIKIKLDLANFNIKGEILDRFFDDLFPPIVFDVDKPLGKIPMDKLTLNPQFSEIFQNKETYELRKLVIENFKQYQTTISELYDAIRDIDDFFKGLIRNINEITRDLLSKGFQSFLPMKDIQACEDAEINIKELCATSSTLKVAIPEEIFHKKILLQREFEDLELKIRRLLEIKVNEENQWAEPKSRYFEPILKDFNFILQNWHANQVINGYKEEVYFQARVLASTLNFMKPIHSKLVEIRNILVIRNFFNEKTEILRVISENFTNLKKLSVLVEIANKLLKKLWGLSRALPTSVAKNPEYFKNPESIKALIVEIPMRLKMEKAQKLISKEIFDSKNEVLENVNALIKSLSELPPYDLSLLEPLESDLGKQ